CRLLALTEQEIAVLISRAKAQRSFHDEGGFVSPQAKLDDAYKVIGVEPEATDAEVKRAYRKLMSQHHPDKLVAKGLPEEMMQVAKEKSQEIQAAYELIKQSRKS
ncbi:MAG: DnaJ domain-containing protein, partial [Pontibacterium sp.]